MLQKPRLLDYIKIHFIVILYAFTAILGNASQANALSIVFFRCVITAISLIGILYASKKSMQVSSRVLWIWIINGFFISLHWLLFFGAAKVSTVAMCLAGLSTQTFWTSILEPIAKKTKVAWIEILLGILVVLALGIIFSVQQAQWLGLLMGIGAGWSKDDYAIAGIDQADASTRIERLDPGDSILACSDGLWHYFTPRELGAIVDALPRAEHGDGGFRIAHRTHRGAPGAACQPGVTGQGLVQVFINLFEVAHGGEPLLIRADQQGSV